MEKQSDSEKFLKSFVVIWFAHLLLDFMMGIWPVYKTLSQMDLAKAGWIAGIGILIGEGLQLFFGILSDRGYQKNLIILGLVLVCCIPFLAYVENSIFLFLLMLGGYIGSGAFHPAGIGLISSWPLARKGVFISLFSCGGMLGEAASQRLFSLFFTYFEGQTYLFLIPLFLLVGLCFWQKFPKPKSQTEKKSSLREILKMLAPCGYELKLLYLLQVLLRVIFLSFIFFLPEILYSRNCPEWFSLGGGHGCYILGSALMSIPAGYLADRYGVKPVLALAIYFSTTFFAVFIFLGHAFSWEYLALVLTLMGACTGVISPLIMAFGTGIVPKETTGLVSGLLMGAATCMASISLISVGAVASYFGEHGPVLVIKGLFILYPFIMVTLGLLLKPDISPKSLVRT